MRKLLAILLLCMVLTACDNTPSNVLSKSDMVDLMTDVEIGEAMVQTESGIYHNDSLRNVMRQSVFQKHNVTQEEYDTSLVWYGHHIDKYIEVYKEVVVRLQDRQKDLASQKETPKNGISGQQVGGNTGGSLRKQYSATKGDTIDMWKEDRLYVLGNNLGKMILKFDYPANGSARQGDRYDLMFRMFNNISKVDVYLGVDYFDGSTSFVFRTMSFEGQNEVPLQTDSTRRVKRIYGYISYDPKVKEMLFIDNLQLLRTHIDRRNYEIYNVQKWIGRKSKVKKATAASQSSNPNAPQTVSTQTLVPPRGKFVPKPGLNKGNHTLHVQNSPNSQHIPH
ncbi:MAG: DUF4296 domain-containing protein [Muribaculaceae bacterium]|jgi:hypothetical protein|nr:DUF4296 domain-containing protein [Muribaculaceae bacterium]